MAADRTTWKIVLGIILLLVNVAKGGFLGFVSPSTTYGMGYDFSTSLIYVVAGWLLYTGFKTKR